MQDPRQFWDAGCRAQGELESRSDFVPCISGPPPTWKAVLCAHGSQGWVPSGRGAGGMGCSGTFWVGVHFEVQEYNL